MPRPNRRANKKKRKQLESAARGNADAGDAQNILGEPGTSADGADSSVSTSATDPIEIGVRGALLTSRRYLRSDARIAAQLISSGVVSPEVAENLMRKAFDLAGTAAETKKTRSFVSLMRLIGTWPKLEIEHRRAIGAIVPVASGYGMGAPPVPPRRDDTPAESPGAKTADAAPPVAFLEAATAEQLVETARILQRLGIFDDMQPEPVADDGTV